MLTIAVGEYELTAPFVTAYSDVNVGTELVRAPGGDAGTEHHCRNQHGQLLETYGADSGDSITLTLLEKGAYLNEWLIRQLVRTNERSDYASDEIFANFRNVAVGNMGSGTYFRSSSPVNNELCRAPYADALAREAGIRTIINLADSAEELESYFAQDDFNSPYKSLYEQGRVVFLNMGVDYRSDDFKAKLKTGLEFLIENEGPYLVHCNEGKDRAGFVSGLLEALAGASVTEIKEDYMQTYINYYGVEYGSDQYEKIAESNILEALREIAGLPKGADLTGIDLEKAAENYLMGIGLSSDQVQLLKERLTTDTVVSDAA